MITIERIAEMQEQARQWQGESLRIALVPTMGFLHDGHISLIERARKLADVVVVSIFVNPTQFSPGEDFSNYPRDMHADSEKCRASGVTAIFAPTPAEMYPQDASTWVIEEELGKPLCGVQRPIHFRGVTTIVCKLFLAALPDVAVFGQKDAQQASIIRRMVRDLNFPVQIDIAPTVREPDGIAMSSRNAYLTDDERTKARSIHRGLQQGLVMFRNGESDAKRLVGAVREKIEGAGGMIEYVECVDQETLRTIENITANALLVVAARFGSARLIDNCVLEIHNRPD